MGTERRSERREAVSREVTITHLGLYLDARDGRVRAAFSIPSSSGSAVSRKPAAARQRRLATFSGSSDQFLNVVSLIPSRRATAARDSSDTSASRTASCRNSAGYFDGRPIQDPFPRARAHYQVSTKPGQLQNATVVVMCARSGAARCRVISAVCGGDEPALMKGLVEPCAADRIRAC
jgi:hypothetical protein